MKNQSDNNACTIIIPAKQKVGVFANAFRVTPDAGEEFLLDFCIYSQHEKEATVISRVRVQKSFLDLIRNTLNAPSQEDAFFSNATVN